MVTPMPSYSLIISSNFVGVEASRVAAPYEAFNLVGIAANPGAWGLDLLE